jgi:tetratricopeptide (TPR) repeat protein
MGVIAMQVRASLFFALMAITVAEPQPSIASPENSSIEQHSEGACSPPIVNNEGHVSISCSGVAPEALHYLEDRLSEQFGHLNDELRSLNDTQRTINNLNNLIDDLHKQADRWAQQYHELSSRLAESGSDSQQASDARELIQKGNFAAAESVLANLASKQEENIAKSAATQYNLGELAVLRFDPSAALPHFKRANQLEPNYYIYDLRYALTAISDRDYDSAEIALQQALEATDGLPTNTTSAINHALVLESLSNVYINTNRTSLAEDVTAQIIAICKPIKSNALDYIPCSEMLINASISLAVVYHSRGQFKDAETVLINAADAARNLSLRFPNIKSDLFTILNNSAIVYTEQGKYDDAKSAADEALGLTSQFPSPLRDIYSSALEINLGAIYLKTTQFDEAEKHFKLALEGRKKLASRAPDTFRSDVAKILVDLSIVYQNTQRINDEYEMLTEAIGIYRTEVVHDKAAGFALIAALKNIAELEAHSGHFKDAENALQEAKNTVAILPNLDSNSRTALSQEFAIRISAAASAARASAAVDPNGK